jgi:hypothetical protein
VRAQDAVELRAQALDGAPALRVQPVRAELHRDAVQRLEGMASSSRLHCVFSGAALHRAAYQVLPISTRRCTGVDVHVGRHAHDAAGGVEHREGQHLAARACRPSRRSISAAMPSGDGTAVYQSFHSSPSRVASRRPSACSCASGSSGRGGAAQRDRVRASSSGVSGCGAA